MSEKYILAAKQANEAVLFFACGGYHTTSAFGTDNSSIEVTVYFDLCDDRNLLESFMTRYEDENDEIVFDKFTTEGLRKFYTLTLIKNLS